MLESLIRLTQVQRNMSRSISITVVMFILVPRRTEETDQQMSVARDALAYFYSPDARCFRQIYEHNAVDVIVHALHQT